MLGSANGEKHERIDFEHRSSGLFHETKHKIVFHNVL